MTPRRGLELETIIAAAAEIADSMGIEAVTLASLAERLGIRSPSLYNHVNGLSGLRQHLAVYGLRLLTDDMEAAIETVSTADVDSVMMEAARVYILFARKHPGLYELTLRAPQENEIEYEAEGKRLLSLLLSAMKPYELNERLSTHMIRGFRSYLHGFAMLEKQGGFGMPLDVDESIRLTLQAFLIGLRQMRG